MEKSVLLSRNGVPVNCKYCAPDFGDIRRLVLGVHGIGGSLEDDIQVGIAEEMELFYSAAFRFDLPCHGQSPVSQMTLDNCTQSLMAVAEFAREQYPEVEDLCIFATGFGAYLTLLCLEELIRLPGKVKLVVQTPSVMMHESLLAIRHISAPTLKAMESITFRTSRPFEVTYRFYEELLENIVLISHPIPMLILHGEQDSVIRMEDILQFRRLNEESKLVIIPGTTHRFLEEGAWDMVLDLTRDWFEFEQVLVADWE